jgi:hypothetical protein
MTSLGASPFLPRFWNWPDPNPVFGFLAGGCLALCYNVFMDKTVTIRLDSGQRKALTEAARREGKTISQWVRDLLAKALRERPLSSKTKHLKGRLALPEASDDLWRRQIRQRNWRS